MASIKREITPVRVVEKISTVDKAIPSQPVLNRVLELFSSVRFGIVMLIALLLCCMIGMLVMQQSVEGFSRYYERLTPAQRSLYDTLKFFDIYHSWYFVGLLATTALNIILSSMDRFPAAWRYIRKPRLAASPKFISAQSFSIKTELHASP